MEKIRVTVWNEFKHEKEMPEVAEIYPDGIHGTIAAFLNKEADIEAGTATLEMPEHGLTEEVLNNTDVLIWWGHCAHHLVSDVHVEAFGNVRPLRGGYVSRGEVSVFCLAELDKRRLHAFKNVHDAALIDIAGNV